MSSVGKTLINALKLRYMSENESAKTTLQMYINNSIRIDSHPKHLEEMDKLINNIARNKDKLDVLENELNL